MDRFKKGDAFGKKKWRIVIDFRKINEDAEQDAYPLLIIENILDQLRDAKFFSVFDLSSGFHQIHLAILEKNIDLFQHQKDILNTIECLLALETHLLPSRG